MKAGGIGDVSTVGLVGGMKVGRGGVGNSTSVPRTSTKIFEGWR